MASSLFASDPRHQRLGLALLRIVIGIVFTMHGYQKFFVYGIPGTTAAFTTMHIPMPALAAPFIAAVELLGGLALIVGLLTRLAALGIALDMVGAILMVHISGGFFLPSGFEYALTLLAGAVALVLGGPGALSIDDAIAARRL
jgi:putative oxidoreductase